ncbi:WxL protein peptidoglycan domain-containing protein [Actinoplanes rectilineatus]|uniref:WxL protein peptidoglycan domain-containing protein n=1 Tax=Actinoplanes rectilineatus TaxID=113571 RepID=UPI0007C785C8|nr:DUF916 domain-containing protein [Actinoplanes rectilineatus]
MRTLALLLAATLTVPAAPVNPTLTWSVAPSGAQGPDGRTALEYTVDPGAHLTDHVTVTNHSEKPLTVRLYASDAYTTAGGGYDLLPAGSAPVDAGSWVTPARDAITLKAGSRTVVPIAIVVPSNATPGDHSGGVVASLVTTTTADGVAVDHRVGTRVHFRVTGDLRPELTVRDLRVRADVPWNPLRLPTVTAAFTVANTGNQRLTAQPTLTVGGGRSTGEALPELLPGSGLRASVTAHHVLPLMRVAVTAGVEPHGVEQVTAIWLVPWPQMVLAGLLVLLVVAVVRRRRRNRRRYAAAIAAAEKRGRESSVGGAAGEERGGVPSADVSEAADVSREGDR